MPAALVPLYRWRRALMIAITILFMLLIFAQIGRADPITLDFSYDAWDPISLSAVRASVSWDVTSIMDELIEAEGGYAFYRMYYDGTQYHVTLRLNSSWLVPVHHTAIADFVLNAAPLYDGMLYTWGTGGQVGGYGYWFIDSNSALAVDNTELLGRSSPVRALFAVTISQSTPIPEPSALTLLAIGLLGLIGYGWRRQHH